MQEGRGIDVQFTADGQNGRTGVVDFDLDVQVHFLRGHVLGFLAEGAVQEVPAARSSRRMPVTGSGRTRHRFSSRGDLHDHAVGNLLIVA
ncbi:hypothetical protein, partial [Streptomyces altiplanensis]